MPKPKWPKGWKGIKCQGCDRMVGKTVSIFDKHSDGCQCATCAYVFCHACFDKHLELVNERPWECPERMEGAHYND